MVWAALEASPLIVGLAELIAIIVCFLACRSLAPRETPRFRAVMSVLGIIVGAILGAVMLEYLKYGMYIFIFMIDLYLLLTVIHELLAPIAAGKTR